MHTALRSTPCGARLRFKDIKPTLLWTIKHAISITCRQYTGFTPRNRIILLDGRGDGLWTVCRESLRRRVVTRNRTHRDLVVAVGSTPNARCTTSHIRD